MSLRRFLDYSISSRTINELLIDLVIRYGRKVKITSNHIAVELGSIKDHPFGVFILEDISASLHSHKYVMFPYFAGMCFHPNDSGCKMVQCGSPDDVYKSITESRKSFEYLTEERAEVLISQQHTHDCNKNGHLESIKNSIAQMANGKSHPLLFEMCNSHNCTLAMGRVGPISYPISHPIHSPGTNSDEMTGITAD